VVGRREIARQTVLLLADRRNSALRHELSKAGYSILETFTADHAVALVVNNPIDAAILDQDLFVETGGWSVAQSLKAVKANVCVLLVMRGRQLARRMPKGVDAIVPADDAREVIAQLQKFGNASQPKQNGKA
jgi:DNA-binding response OmpR family regulator